MNETLHHFNVPSHANLCRIDKFLAEQILDVSRNTVQNWLTAGLVRRNGIVITKSGTTLKTNDIVELDQPPSQPMLPEKLIPESFDYPILYEDAHLLIINKPPNVVVHPAPGHYQSGTLVHALLSYLPELQEEYENVDEDERTAESALRPGIVHRLDKDTSGCLIVAKTPECRLALSRMFAEHTIHKIYLACCVDGLKTDSGTIQTLIGRHKVNRKKMAVVENGGRMAITHYHVMERFTFDTVPCAVLKINLETGRTHQIRVHLAHLKSPIIGDELYGTKRGRFAERQMLHAWQLHFVHPMTRQEINVEAPVPPDMIPFLGALAL